MPKVMRTAPATAPMKRRFRKKCGSSIGYGIRFSQYAKRPSTSTATAAVPSTRADVQPCSGPEMIAKTSAAMPTVDSRAPSRSGRSPCGLLDSGTRTITAARASAATGRLIRKIAPHQKWLSMNPPISGPAAKPSALTALQMPMALGCSSAVKICIATARVGVSSSAPPTPMPARDQQWP
jgi:hypothetical protein